MTEAVNFAAGRRIDQGDRLWTQPNREDDGSRISPMILIITESQKIGACFQDESGVLHEVVNTNPIRAICLRLSPLRSGGGPAESFLG